jgi:hypothetical protein
VPVLNVQICYKHQARPVYGGYVCIAGQAQQQTQALLAIRPDLGFSLAWRVLSVIVHSLRVTERRSSPVRLGLAYAGLKLGARLFV